MLPRHQRSRTSQKSTVTAPQPAQTNHGLPKRRALTPEELQGLRETIQAKVKWRPDDFQMEAIEAQLKLEDVIVHAGTGLGKTAIVAGPHMHPSSKGKVTLMVSPLIALHNEQVSIYIRSVHIKSKAYIG
jgi:ATP-dependent helicase YprA (DUF1998 family)